MTNREFRYGNGDEVKEKVTGFTGVITGTAFYITGCNQYLVVGKAKDIHSEAVSSWYDEGRLELVKSNKVSVNEVSSDDPGCDREAPNKG